VTSSRDRAWNALSARLRDTLELSIADLFVGGTHTRRFEDNLLPGLTISQIRTIRSRLEQGDGRELEPTPTGKRRAHAPYSSAALAANAFGRWIGAEPALEIAQLRGFDPPLSLEHKLRIAHCGGEANLDCVLQGPGLMLGIESKLTETLTPHDPVEWRAPYHSPKMQHLLADGWAAVFRDSRAGQWTPSHLGLEQLIKHALALQTHARGRETHLVYCYWEPRNADTIPEPRAHREEVAELLARVAGARPQFHALTYADLLNGWEAMSLRPPWVPEHLAQLRARYDVEI